MSGIVDAAVVVGCLWLAGKTWDGLKYWWRKTCTGDGDASLWFEKYDGDVPEKCPDCGRKVMVEEKPEAELRESNNSGGSNE